LLIGELATLLISPLGTAVLLGLFALIAAAASRSRLAMASGMAAVVWLWVWSTPAASLWVRYMIEQQHPARPVASMPTARAIVVLGGVVSPPTTRGQAANLTQAADRLWHAARLYRAGKAPLILVSGGSDAEFHTGSEARAMRAMLGELGVPSWAVVLEEKSRNTRQNAEYSAALLRARGVDRVLLVTSALHMERARMQFVAQGLRVETAPTDHEGAPRPTQVMDILPNTEALDGSARALKELVGQAVLWVTR
jgi:uncharacterized SAM-binding protein YcdF (DUF218 family)